ncbi:MULTISPECIES: extracellular solute-binding protein [unclassified Paenibacillus]|uniref:extracellular solute-binding protein n=1 Tax=unclassified Paenibacillus TaxID=185978 RepID=UPI00362C2089
MKTKSRIALGCAVILTVGAVAGCSDSGGKPTVDEKATPAANSPFEITLASYQGAETPVKGNEIEKAIEAYTNTKLSIQWIPLAAFDEKINVMIASNELPKLLRVRNDPSIRDSIKSGLFWEIGPYLKEYKNLSAQQPVNYELSTFDGKRYGIPLFRNVGRSSVIYRKDWLDALGMKLPTTVDEWYNVLKAMTLNDPDKNGKNDTYGMLLYKNYNDGLSSMMVRLAVSLGAPTKWGQENGKFTPDFMTKEYQDVLRLFKRLYDEKLINQDFAVFDEQDSRKLFQSGRAGIIVNVSDNAKKFNDPLLKVEPNAILDVEPTSGPKGIRVGGFPDGTSGFYLVPKSSVKTEAELKQVLSFMDKLMDPEISTLLLRGIEGKHYVKTADNKTEYKDFTLWAKDVRTYADNLPVLEGYNVAPLKDIPLGEKATKIEMEGHKYAVPNPALSLVSAMYTERGKELDNMIQDAQTKFIMGKIDEAGWQSEIERWRKAGGDKVIKDYEEAFAKLNNKK